MPTPMPKTPLPELRCCGATNAEQQPEADDVQGDDDEREQTGPPHSAGVSEPDRRAQRELRAGKDRAAIELSPRIVAARRSGGQRD